MYHVAATVEFTHAASGVRRRTEMFFAGENSWAFRFTGTKVGTWSFVTTSDDEELRGHTGRVSIVPNPRSPAMRSIGTREGITPIMPAMTAAIVHRGPDEEGLMVADRAALGMRRLSIIDLAGGSQPISNEDGTIQVVFNGEIYNFAEIRAELERHGHRFETRASARAAIFEYIEVYYNQQRLHSSLGYLSPAEYEVAA